jgi:hypothetical protein
VVDDSAPEGPRVRDNDAYLHPVERNPAPF